MVENLNNDDMLEMHKIQGNTAGSRMINKEIREYKNEPLVDPWLLRQQRSEAVTCSDNLQCAKDACKQHSAQSHCGEQAQAALDIARGEGGGALRLIPQSLPCVRLSNFCCPF